MSKAPNLTGLAAFTRKLSAQQQSTVVPETAAEMSSEPVASTGGPERKKTRGAGDTVSMTVRLSRADWERLHQLAVSERTSIQRLAIDGFSKVFAEKGLPGMTS